MTDLRKLLIERRAAGGRQMTTVNAPTIEEQIEAQKEIIAIHENEEWHQDEIEMDKSILASLKELQSIRSAEMPVEPDMKWLRGFINSVPFLPGIPKDDIKKAHGIIDSLKQQLQVAQEERDAKDRMITNYEEWLSVSGENAKELQERAEKAEAINRRMVERMKEPSANMKSAGYGKPDYLAIFKAMSAELIKEVEK